jgi:hypothetical protein
VVISLKALIMEKHSAVYEEAIGDRLLVKEICKLGMKKEKPAEIDEIDR